MQLACDVCGQAFDGRHGARFCSGRCRTQAYRQRTQPEQPKRRRPPITDSMDRAVWRLAKAAESVKRYTTDDRFDRNRDTIRNLSGKRVALAADDLDAVLDALGWNRPAPQPRQPLTVTAQSTVTDRSR